MSANINYEIKKSGEITIFKLNEKRFDSSIAGLVKVSSQFYFMPMKFKD